MKSQVTRILAYVCFTIASSGISHATETGNLIQDHVLGRNFCSLDGGRVVGWGFGTDGVAYPIDSLAGMPSPWQYYQIAYLRPADRFNVLLFDRHTDLPIRTIARFVYDANEDALRVRAERSGVKVLRPENCK